MKRTKEQIFINNVFFEVKHIESASKVGREIWYKHFVTDFVKSCVTDLEKHFNWTAPMIQMFCSLLYHTDYGLNE
jgi:hypothetical protein